MPARSILAWLAIGLVVGIIGRFATPGRVSGGTVGSIMIGIAGALVVGFIAETMQWTPSGGWHNFAAATLGAAAALVIYRWIGHHKR